MFINFGLAAVMDRSGRDLTIKATDKIVGYAVSHMWKYSKNFFSNECKNTINILKPSLNLSNLIKAIGNSYNLIFSNGYDNPINKIKDCENKLKNHGSKILQSSEEFTVFLTMKILSLVYEEKDSNIEAESEEKQSFIEWLKDSNKELFINIIKANILSVFANLTEKCSLDPKNPDVGMENIWGTILDTFAVFLYRFEDELNRVDQLPFRTQKDKNEVVYKLAHEFKSLDIKKRDVRKINYQKIAEKIWNQLLIRCFPNCEKSIFISHPQLQIDVVQASLWKVLKKAEPFFIEYFVDFLEMTRFFRQAECQKKILQEKIRVSPTGHLLVQGCSSSAKEFMKLMTGSIESFEDILENLDLHIFNQALAHDKKQRKRFADELRILAEQPSFSLDALLSLCEKYIPSISQEAKVERKNQLVIYHKRLEIKWTTELLIEKIPFDFVKNNKHYLSPLLNALLHQNDLGMVHFRQRVESHIEILLLKVVLQSNLFIENNFNRDIQNKEHPLASFLKFTLKSNCHIKKDFNEIEQQQQNGNNIIINDNWIELSENENESDEINFFDVENSEMEEIEEEEEFFDSLEMNADVEKQFAIQEKGALTQLLFHLFLGVNENEELFGIPVILDQLIRENVCQLLFGMDKRVAGLHALYNRTLHYAEQLEGESIPSFEIISASDGVSFFVLNTLKKIISVKDQEGSRVVLKQCLGLLSDLDKENTLQTTAIFKNIISEPASIQFLENSFAFLNSLDSEDYNKTVCNTIDVLIADRLNRILSPLLSSEKSQKIDLEKQLLLKLLPILKDMMKYWNAASKLEGGLNGTNVRKATGEHIHPAVPNESQLDPALSAEAKKALMDQQRVVRMYAPQMEKLLALLFPGGREFLCAQFKESAPEAIDWLFDKGTAAMPLAVNAVFKKETIRSLFTTIFEKLVENFEKPISFKPELIKPLVFNEELTEEEKQQRKLLHQQIGALIVEGARYLELPVDLCARFIPGFAKQIVGWDSIEQQVVASIGEALCNQFNGELLDQCIQIGLEKVADFIQIKEGEEVAPLNPIDNKQKLLELQKRLAKLGVNYPLKWLEAMLWDSTDIFGDNILNDLRIGALCIVSCFIKSIAFALRLLGIEYLASTIIHRYIQHRTNKVIRTFAQPELSEDALYKFVETTEQILEECFH